MKGLRSYETSLTIYQSKRRNISKTWILKKLDIHEIRIYVHSVLYVYIYIYIYIYIYTYTKTDNHAGNISALYCILITFAVNVQN